MLTREYECKLCGKIYCDEFTEKEYYSDPEHYETVVELRKEIHLQNCPNNQRR